MRRWVALLLVAVACSTGPRIESTRHFRVASESFDPGGSLPVRFTCDGEDVPPSFGWENVPSGTVSMALVMRDLDADFVHWVVLGIPAQIGFFQAGHAPSVAIEGANDFDSTGYRGPCPPKGDHPHTYVFTFYAIDRPGTAFSDSFHQGDSLDDMFTAIPEGSVLATGTIEATYGR
jgi:Raf kinase inhibitor-like YbhB/YbcL family protein